LDTLSPEASQGGVREAAVSKTSLEGVEARKSSPFFLHFFLFYFLTELLESGKPECALLIEERRRKPGDLFTRAVSASRSVGGRFARDGTRGSEKLKIMVPSRWKSYS